MSLLLLLGWGAFRVWLSQQPPGIRRSIGAFTTREFIVVLRDEFFPSPPEDRAGFGRRSYAGRGHSPWVLRSSLDGRPRMLSLALAPELWLSYSTETASIHQFWQGEIDFKGPVYDAQHGFEPLSSGRAYLRPPVTTAWRVREGDVWYPAGVRWRAHGLDPESGAVWLRFELRDDSGGVRTITEWPERVAEGTRVGLERRFTTSSGPGPAVALAVDSASGELETKGRLLDEPLRNEALREESLLVIAAGETRLLQWFDAPSMPIGREQAEPLDNDAFAVHDCSTCHNERERITGPAWSEIALRYKGMNPATTVNRLATKIIEGSEGEWGSVAMTPHSALPREEAQRLARLVLEMEPADALGVDTEASGAVATWSRAFETEPRPETLHPSLTAMRINPPEFTPQVGGLAWLPDGRLGVATWDRDGAVFAVEAWEGGVEAVRIERIAEGLHEPLGLAVVGDDIYVMQKQELTQLVDLDGDGWTDEYRSLTNDWRVTSNFHEFGFGLEHIGAHLYGSLSICVLTGGKSCRQQTPDRGKVFRVSLATGELEFIASGLRTPNGLARTPDGSLLVTDNQGDWLPASKLIRVRTGEDYGWRAPGDERDLEHGPVTPPTLWLPQSEVGNSPTQPLVLTQGPYAGHVIFGDVFNGGIKRAALQEVGGQLQGAAFHFSGGLQAPVNRLLEAPDGAIVVGQVGSRGNWGEYGKRRFGLELLRFGSEPAFEPLRVEATSAGFDIHFSRALASDLTLEPDHFGLSQWFYIPSEIYGGPKYDLTELPVRAVVLSEDRRVASLTVAGLAAGRVVYLNMGDEIRSAEGESLWVNEAWYTMNVLPGTPAREGSPNTLSAAERAAGWRLLFDGESFEGWKIYGAEDDAIEAWVIEDGAFKFTRDVSGFGLIWNHINPFSTAAIDLMTRERFGSFELRVDWKISAGGNSGIFYLVPDEEASLAWTYGLEMQVLDDDGHSDGEIERHRAGDLYDLKASTRRAARPVGDWNTAGIRVEGNHIEHWLNGEKLLEITRGSPEWERAHAASKFADTEGHGLATSGHITFQDHGDVVWYRNIKIRELPTGD